MYSVPYTFIEDSIVKDVLQHLRWNYFKLQFAVSSANELQCSENLEFKKFETVKAEISGFVAGANYIARKMGAKCE